RTFFAGKWHLGGEGFYPEQQGFDINQGGHEAGSPPGGYYSPYHNPMLADGPPGEYLTDRLASESIRFLEAAKNDPFLLYLSFYTVHTPIQACTRYLTKFEEELALIRKPDGGGFRQERAGWTKLTQDRADYATMVHAMDANVGRVLDKLDELGLADKTVVIFTTDNGGLSTLGTRRGSTSNLPLRAGKGWCYEGGIRVPMIVRAPGVTRTGGVCSVPVTSTDFYPTMLELAGLALRPKQHVDGRSFRPLLRGAGSLGRSALYWHYPHYHGSMWTPGAAIRAGDWKLIEFYEENDAELYHLAEDPGESRDLSSAMPEKKSELLNLLHGWQRETGAKMPRPNADHKAK
ncbi:MAG: sulfatase, partial [Acidobacteriota bacterium]